MAGPGVIDYARLLEADRGAVGLISYLKAELPWLWVRAYKGMTPHEVNVHELTGPDGYEYLFDHVGQLVEAGLVPAHDAAPDRLVAVYGCSRRPTAKRDASRMRPFPLGAAVAVQSEESNMYDRGHMVAHGSGGGLDINLVPQLRSLNQGRSEQGRRYRALERYCAQHEGTFCFARLIYTTLTDHPRWIELGVLKNPEHLHAELFDNVGSDGEMAEIESRFRARVRACSTPSETEQS